MNADAIKQGLQDELKKRDIDAVGIAKKYDSSLFGLFTPWPSYPPQELTLDSLLTHGFPRCVLLFVLASGTTIGAILLLIWMRLEVLILAILGPLGYGGYKRMMRDSTDVEVRKTGESAGGKLEWHTHCKEYFGSDTLAGQLRKHAAAEEVLASVKPQQATAFNEHVKGATSLAVYGCGILAAGHVGGLRALEKHGMRYENLATLAGVSAGSVVVASVAVGYTAEELFQLVLEMPFHLLAYPELGSILRMAGTILQDLATLVFGRDVGSVFEPLARGTGPGVNSGKALYKMVGDALQRKTGDPDITFKEVQDRFKKRLVIVVLELDSGNEVHLTPESNPDLPVRAAVRMSMGVPGLMEPFSYNGHYYSDGGMANDFPMNALPDDGHRLGLMIRPLDWIEYHYGGINEATHRYTGVSKNLEKFPKVAEYFGSYESKTKAGLHSVRSPLDLAITSCTIMMDANLMLQIKGAMATRGNVKVTELAPEILTLCGGRLDPFDFMMAKEQHRDLYLSGQLCVHLHADQVDEGKDVVSPEGHIKALLYFLNMDPPPKFDKK